MKIREQNPFISPVWNLASYCLVEQQKHLDKQEHPEEVAMILLTMMLAPSQEVGVLPKVKETSKLYYFVISNIYI